MQEKRKKKKFAYCKRRQKRREEHKGVMFLLEDIFQFCWRTTLFSACLSYLNRSYARGSTLKGLGCVFILYSPDSHFIKDFPLVAFVNTEILSFLTFTCSVLAARTVRTPSTAPLFTSIVVANIGPNTLNSLWFLHCRKLLYNHRTKKVPF